MLAMVTGNSVKKRYAQGTREYSRKNTCLHNGVIAARKSLPFYTIDRGAETSSTRHTKSHVERPP